MTQLLNGLFAALVARGLVIGVDDGDQVLSSAAFKDNDAFQITGADSAGRIVTVPALGKGKVSIWQADETNAYAVSVRCGTGAVSLDPGQCIVLAADGSANGIAGSELTGSVSSSAWQTVTGAQTAKAGEHLEYKLTAPAVLTLPLAPAEFATVTIRNLDGSFGTHTLTVAGNGVEIGSPEGGYTDDLTVDLAYVEMALVYFGGKWRILV